MNMERRVIQRDQIDERPCTEVHSLANMCKVIFPYCIEAKAWLAKMSDVMYLIYILKAVFAT